MEPSPRRRVSASPRRPLRRFSDSVRDMRAVFADCHVGRRPDDDGPFLAGLEEAARRGANSISLLGDIFHFFIAHPKFETPAIHRFLRKVEELKGRGVPVTYVEGNQEKPVQATLPGPQDPGGFLRDRSFCHAADFTRIALPLRGSKGERTSG